MIVIPLHGAFSEQLLFALQEGLEVSNVDSQNGTDQETLERNLAVPNNQEMLETLGPRVRDPSAHQVSLAGMGARMKV